MTDDALIAGAAAPTGRRWIRSSVVLDAVWAGMLAVALVATSPVPLIDLEGTYLRTFDAPLRVYVVFVPLAALVVAAAGAWWRSGLLVTVATGMLVPSIALAGSLAGSLFLDDLSPFTEAGVPLTFAVSIAGVFVLVRWVVYSDPPIAGVDDRPPAWSASALLVLGLLLVVNQVVNVVRNDDGWSLATIVATAFMASTPLMVVVAGLLRTVRGHVLAVAACAAQVVDIAVADVDGADAGLDSITALRTGAVGLVLLVGAAAVALAGALRPEPTDASADLDASDDAAWRWSFDDA